uniref:Immunoglobulin domain-containing protein n=1 Tax=Terrapene triunguis TaxID=2587831 RepID=A0A674JSJ7_9SAUR
MLWTGRSGCARVCLMPHLLHTAELRSPKPSISLSPSQGGALGGAMTVWYRGQRRGLEFVLYKAGAKFPIPKVTRADRGSYTCYYPPDSDPDTWSEPSDPVKLVVAGEGYPKPNISMSPSGGVSLGGAVTVRCRGQRRGVWFVLNKERRHFPPVDSDGFEAVFSSSNVHRDLGGSYSCSYHSRSEPFAVSYPSDPMELVVRGEGPGSASPFPAPPPARPSRGLGGQRRDVRFFLHKAGDLNLQRHVDPAGDVAKFRIRNVGRQHGGNYSCSYRRRSEPFVSSYTSTCLLYADPNLPRPSISLSPTGVTATGADVTIRCQGQRQDVRFFLHKAGDLNPQRHMDPAGDGAEFHIPTVGWQHGGSYSCSYRPRLQPFISSYASSSVELVVAGEGPGSTFLLPAGPSEGRHLMGCSEPGSAQTASMGGGIPG